MKIFDTNVVSELIRQNRDENVVAWVDAQPLAELFVTAITEAELRDGVAVMPNGKRKRALEADVRETWAFKVGGYQVCEKWLKDRKGRMLTSDDVDHYRNVVAALTRSQSLMQEIDGVVNGVLWPKP